MFLWLVILNLNYNYSLLYGISYIYIYMYIYIYIYISNIGTKSSSTCKVIYNYKSIVNFCARESVKHVTRGVDQSASSMWRHPLRVFSLVPAPGSLSRVTEWRLRVSLMAGAFFNNPYGRFPIRRKLLL